MIDMTEALSKGDLIRLFYKLGIRPGMTLEVHASLSSLGYVIGGAQTFNDALIELLGEEGTLIMPLQRGDADDPASWRRPPAVYELQEKIRREAPAFDTAESETYKMSKIYDNLRRRKKAVVSKHPSCGFVALGKRAKYLCTGQPYDFPLGKGSPLEKLVQLKAFCLLCGVSYDNMTSLHFGEILSGIRPVGMNGANIIEDGEKVHKNYLIHDVDSDDGFLEIGERLESRSLVSRIREGERDLRLLRTDIAVLEAMRYYRERMKYYQI